MLSIYVTMMDIRGSRPKHSYKEKAHVGTKDTMDCDR